MQVETGGGDGGGKRGPQVNVDRAADHGAGWIADGVDDHVRDRAGGVVDRRHFACRQQLSLRHLLRHLRRFH